MSTLQIDRLLEYVVKKDCSDLHLTTGRPPTVRLNGTLQNLKTKVLDSDDMVALMKSVTPEKNQQELQEVGSTDFGFAYGDAARFRVAVFKQRHDVAMVLRLIPNDLLTFEQIGLPPIVTIGLGIDLVYSLNRTPNPPARIITFINLFPNHNLFYLFSIYLPLLDYALYL